MTIKNEENIFPIVDMQYLTEKYNDKEYTSLPVDDPQLQKLADELANGFIKWGFIYLINHGIKEEDIKKSFVQSRQFFTLDKEIKNQVLRPYKGENFGYVPFEVETFEKNRPFDLKECFNFFPLTDIRDEISKVAPDFFNTQSNFYKRCHQLTMKLLFLVNKNLSNDPNFLTDQHKLISNQDGNPTITRLLYYPPIKSRENIENNQLRCGEHSDYGTITLLFQDEAGGLQVVNPSGEYVDAIPIPGSIVVNAGDLLEIWSSGKFKSTKHRVLVPEKFEKPRQSIAFFCHPDKTSNAFCLDGSNKYESVNSFEHLQKKFEETYG